MCVFELRILMKFVRIKKFIKYFTVRNFKNFYVIKINITIIIKYYFFNECNIFQKKNILP